MILALFHRRRGQVIELQKLLLCFFVGVSVIPVLFIGGWIEHNALKREASTAEQKHLLLAKNLSETLSRYVQELEATFSAKSESSIGPFSPDMVELMQSFNIQMVALMKDTQTEYCMGDASAMPASMESLLRERQQALRHPGSVSVSPVMLNKRGEPMFYLLRLTRAGKVALAAVDTGYVKQVQRGITFGEGGHAVVVDQRGQVLAHPDRVWESTAISLSQLEPVQLMLSQQTGVVQFYSPAGEAEMIAGYAYVPKTNWGIMIPQPLRELQVNTLRTRIVAVGVSILGMLLAVLVSWRITAYILEPLKAVIHASRSLKAGQSVSRVADYKRPYVPAEIQNLLRAFDQMAAEVSQVRVTLERQVEERTHKLVEEVERRKQLERQLIEKATHDSLTGLPNRRLLSERLQSTLDFSRLYQRTLALLFLDLDGFKQVNDTYGHSVGDELLVQVSERLRANLRKGDTVFRLGGDEFVILVEHIESESMAKQLASDLIDVLRSPFCVQNIAVCIGGSIGIKISQRHSKETASELLSDADSAMYQAKATGNCAIVH